MREADRMDRHMKLLNKVKKKLDIVTDRIHHSLRQIENGNEGRETLLARKNELRALQEWLEKLALDFLFDFPVCMSPEEFEQILMDLTSDPLLH